MVAPTRNNKIHCRDRRPRQSKNERISRIKNQPVGEGLAPPENKDRKQKTDDLMEGGKPPRDCKQSLRPYKEF